MLIAILCVLNVKLDQIIALNVVIPAMSLTAKDDVSYHAKKGIQEQKNQMANA